MNKSWRVIDIKFPNSLKIEIKKEINLSVLSFEYISISLLDHLMRCVSFELKRLVSRFRDCCIHEVMEFPTFDLTNYGYEEKEEC